jgi:uncharacterized protein YjbI with pentapeptide repeats
LSQADLSAANLRRSAVVEGEFASGTNLRQADLHEAAQLNDANLSEC